MSARPAWILLAAAGCAGLSVAAKTADLPYLPAALMFLSALCIVGFASLAEDRLIARYDTPHSDRAHPPPLVLFRMGRVVAILLMAGLVFLMAF